MNVSEESDPKDRAGIMSRMLSAFSKAKSDLGIGKPSEIRERWLASHITFPGHAKTTICTSYEAHYSSDRAFYIVGTGRNWKDSIGKAVFLVDSSAVGGARNIKMDFPVAPGPRLLSESLTIFQIENAEPPPDAKLVIYARRP